jgi:hypothetical protein
MIRVNGLYSEKSDHHDGSSSLVEDVVEEEER